MAEEKAREKAPAKDKDKDRERNYDRGGRDDDGGGMMKRSFHRGRGCRFCAEPQMKIDYKDALMLRPFLTERYKMVPRRISGNCASHQRELTNAIKIARHLAFIPYSSAQIVVPQQYS